MSIVLQVQQNGIITLPISLMQEYNINEGAELQLVDLDGTFVLSQRRAAVPKLAAAIEQKRIAAGLTTADLLASLRQERGQS